MSRPSLAVFLGLTLAAAVLILTGTDQLPASVASHFGGNDLPNGWMTARGYRMFMLAFGIGLPVAIVGLLRWLPGAFPNRINIPNRAFWLAPERRQASLDFLAGHAYRFGCLMVLFMLAIHLLILEANASVPPRLPRGPFLATLGAFLAGMVWWIAAIYVRFRRARQR